MGDYFAEHAVSASSSRGGSGGSGINSALSLAMILSQQATFRETTEAAAAASSTPLPSARLAEGERLESRLRELLQDFTDRDPSVAGTPPASEAAIRALGRGTGDGSCAVCAEEYEVSEPQRFMPCGHGYHEECIVPWLKCHATCPICRKEVESKSSEYEEDKKERGRQSAVSDLMSSLYN